MRSTSASASSLATPRAASLFASSLRECSRLTSSPSARCAGLGSGLRRLRRPSSAGVPEPCSGTPWRSMEDTRRSGLRALFGRLRHHLRRELLAQGRLDPGSHRRVVLEVLAGVLLALADAFAVAAVPGAGLLDQLGVHAQVDQPAFAAAALPGEEIGRASLRGRGGQYVVILVVAVALKKKK